MKTLTYGKLFITILGIEGDLIVNIKIKNNASVQSILFPNEEVRLIADNKVVPLDNYAFENNLDPGQEVTGKLFFKDVKAKKKVLQFGKNVLPKVNVDLV